MNLIIGIAVRQLWVILTRVEDSYNSDFQFFNTKIYNNFD